jgi:phosphoribosyl 1,2-cyclic phosphodiesterase
MELQVIGSNSKGNAYILQGSKNRLLLEAGIPYNKLIKEISYQLPDACIITHEHLDHSFSGDNLMQNGVNVYCTEGTSRIFKKKNHNLHIIKYLEQKKICDEFEIKAFKTKHDCIEPCGFIIKNTITNEKLLFATDTAEMYYTFDNIDHIIIEANFAETIMRRNKSLKKPVRDKIRVNHFEITKCLNFLKACDTRETQSITLIHLSYGNSNESDFIRLVDIATGIKPEVAKAGLNIKLGGI